MVDDLFNRDKRRQAVRGHSSCKPSQHVRVWLQERNKKTFERDVRAREVFNEGIAFVAEKMERFREPEANPASSFGL